MPARCATIWTRYALFSPLSEPFVTALARRRDISARVSSPAATARALGAELEAGGGVAVVGAGAGDACATVVGRNIESNTASIGSEDDALAAAATPAASAPVLAADPIVDKRRAAPITTATAHTRPPCRPSRKS